MSLFFFFFFFFFFPPPPPPPPPPPLSFSPLRWGMLRATPSTIAAILLAAAVFRLSPSREFPTPESVVGFAPGAESKLATYDQTIEYFKKLDAASDQMMLVEAGTSTQGRTYYFALISSKENLEEDRSLPRDRAAAGAAGRTDRGAGARAGARRQAARAHRRRAAFDRSRRPAAHAAARATTCCRKPNDPQIARILDNVILMLWPTINPDGHQMVADWYMKNVGTPNESLPRLYQEYVGHDNNRDAYMLNMIESRVMEHAWRQWEPQIIYVQHQSSPFPTRIWLPPFAEPIATHAPFLMSREVNTIGMAIAQGLEERGQVGATHMGTGYDAWYAGLHRLHADVQEHRVVLDRDRAGRHGEHARIHDRRLPAASTRTCGRRRSIPSPWAPGKWTLRDAVDYMDTASLSVLDYAARYKENVLLNRYRSGKRQIEKHRKEGPFAYCHPAGPARYGRPRSRCCGGSRSAAFACRS